MNLHDLILTALKEDMPSGDVTTENLGLGPHWGRAKLIAKQDLTLSGMEAFEQTVLALDPETKLKWHFNNGDQILQKQIICTIQGDLIQLLKAERVGLNLLMHLSGIATLTNQFVKRVSEFNTKILDTRKTTPGYRDLEKKAVVHGGGKNHRMNLSDAIMIKDNHITVMGGITPAVQKIRNNSNLPITVEARTLEDVRECVDLGVARILLDNMNLEMMANAVRLIPSNIEIEASGNMNLERVRDVASVGVHFISVGALTHSAPSADISLMFHWDEK